MNDSVPVEICIPTFNRASYLSQAIDSALNQDYKNVRVVVVDNHSTDATAHVVQQYCANPRFEYYVNDLNVGMTGNLNRCLDRRGDGFFTILCSDNILKPDFASRMVRIFQENRGVDVVTACTETLSESSGTIVGESVRLTERPRFLDPAEVIQDSFICFNAFMTRPGLVFRFDERLTYSPDERLWRDWAVAELGIYYLPEVVATYRAHDSNMSKTTSIFRQYHEFMDALAWIDESFGRYQIDAAIGMARLTAYLRSTVERPGDRAALLDLLETLHGHRATMLNTSPAQLEFVLSPLLVELNGLLQRFAGLAQDLSARAHLDGLEGARARDAVTEAQRRPARFHSPLTPASSTHTAVLSTIERLIESAEHLGGMAEIVDLAQYAAAA